MAVGQNARETAGCSLCLYLPVFHLWPQVFFLVGLVKKIEGPGLPSGSIIYQGHLFCKTDAYVCGP